jgi:MFS family permease
LLVTGLIEPWHFGVAALIEGTVGAVQMPVRQALVPSVVPRQHLMNAISLSGSTQQLAKTVAPALAGVIAALLGAAAALFFEAALYFAAMLCTSQLSGKLTFTHPIPGRPASEGGDSAPRRGRRTLLDGFRGYGYLRENPVVGWLVVLAIVPIIFSFANNTMAPVFAREVLGLGPGGIGLLLSAPGIGSLVATVICAWKGDFPRSGLLSMAGIFFMGITTIVYGLSSWLWLSLLALALHGTAQTFYRVLNHTLVQMHTPDEYRGRVMATYYMDRSFNPLGTLVVAGMADIWSPQAAMVVSGIGCVLTVLVVGARARAVRELD